MSDKYHIKQYFVEPDFAKWLKERGFDGECTHFKHPNLDTIVHGLTYEINNSLGSEQYTVPTFAQAFDFAKEKFGLIVAISDFFGEIEMSVDLEMKDGTKCWYKLIIEDDFKTKREASIAACNAIRDYISKSE